MDLQFILNPYSCISYIINYITKIDAGLSKLLRETSNDILAGNMDLKHRLRILGNTYVNGNVLTSQEAVYHLLSIPLTSSSRKCIYINTLRIDERYRMMKSKTDLEKLDENSLDIYNENIYDKYSKRNKESSHLCLAEFATKINIRKKKLNIDNDNDDNIIDEENDETQRQRTKILRSRRYRIEDDKHNYYRENVLLFVPWRNELNEIESQN